MKEIVQRFYDDCAPAFDEEQDEFAFVRTPEKKIVADAFDKILGPDQTMLEIGAGTGRFTLMAAPRVKHVTAIDISPNMLQQMAHKQEKSNITNIDRIQGCFMEMDFNQRFDVIVSFSAIEYIKDKEALFKKMSGLLNPGGRLILTTAHNTFFRFWGRLGNYFRQKTFMQAYGKRQMRRLLSDNGLRVVEMEDLCMKYPLISGIMLFVHAAK